MPRKNTVPQRYRVLQYARHVGTKGFTRLDIATEVGCYELASRIGELEAEGVTFTRERFTGQNRYGDRVPVMRYRLLYLPINVLETLRTRLQASQ